MAKDKIERAIIAGASEALNLKAKSPLLFDEEILKQVVKKIKEIKEKID